MDLQDELEVNYYRIRSGNFRVRNEKNEEKSKKKKAELFHIKSHRRDLVGAYRFSVSGFPCLYLASDVRLSWLECGMPKQFSYCRIGILGSDRESLELIDFSIRPVDLISSMHCWILGAKDDNEKKRKALDFFLKYIITYPLIASCSLKVKDRSSKFVEEYIISQIFMHWIKEDREYDGIKYKSLLNTTLTEGMGAVNIALPAREFRKDGLCKILTSKISVSDIEYLDVGQDFKRYQNYLKDIKEFRNMLLGERVKSEYTVNYLNKIIDLCNLINLIYQSIIEGNEINDITLQQIACISDYIDMIYENKEQIIKEELKIRKSKGIETGEDKLRSDIFLKIEKFYELTTKMVHKNMLFYFNIDNDLENYEEI